jgi:hypothetical protein
MFTNDIIGSSRADDGRVDNKPGAPVRRRRAGREGDAVAELRTLVATGGENDSITRQLARHVKETGERYVKGFKVTSSTGATATCAAATTCPSWTRLSRRCASPSRTRTSTHQHQNLRTGRA